MHKAPERRSTVNPRVPLDDVLVELVPEGFDEGFEADAVDLGNGGLAMRAPLLPDIGSTLRCSFRSPTDGEPVDADCEVVWAKDSGPSEGHFGLRFTQVPQDSAHAIGRIVDQWMDVLGEHLDAESDVASLALEGVRSPFVGEVADRAHDVLRVEQELPFLRIGTHVQEDGQRQGRLASVEIRMDDDTPRLVLTVVYADSSPGVEEAAAEDSPALDQAGMDEVAFAEAAAKDESWALVSDPSIQLVEASDADMSLDADATFRQEAPPEMDAVTDAWQDVAPQTPNGAEGMTDGFDDDEALARSMTPARDLATLWRRSAPKLRAAVTIARTGASKVKTRALPLWASFVTRLSALMADLRGTHWPAFSKAISRFLARVRVFVSALLARRRSTGDKPSTQRRTTRAPAAHPQRTARRSAQAAPGQAMSDRQRVKNRRRAALLGGLALIAGATAWAFSRGEEASASAPDTSEHVSAVETTPMPAVVAAPAVRSPYAAEPEQAVDPEQGEQIEAAPSVPAEPASALAAGRIESPTFPSIGSGPIRHAGISAATFGAEAVPRAREFTLRMSQRVAGVRGEELPDGFRVDVDGALSLDRAGPIAAAHPSVERATILNRGDHAELRVRFVSGRHPAYRVEARGSSVVVSIGR